jgi:hypothetical protein
MKALRMALIGIALMGLGSGTAMAQPASESPAAGAQLLAPTSTAQNPMMHGGMMGEAMGRGGGCGMMGEMHGMGEMGMVMQEMNRDPKLRGRMIELHGEMMRALGQALIDRGKQMQQGGGKQMQQDE